MTEAHLGLERRSFLSRLSAGAAAVGAVLVGRDAAAQSTPAGGPFTPARHSLDDWLDALGGRHRIFFDTTTPIGLGEGIFFANNYFTANKNGYGVEAADVAVVISVRHKSTPFAFSDAMWVKYSEGLSERAGNFTDPKTKVVPTINVFRAAGYGPALTNMGVTIDAIAKTGAHFSVCQLATRACAAAIARRTGGKAEDIYAELTSNLVPNAHMVPAGIVAVNRAQERGYSFSYTG